MSAARSTDWDSDASAGDFGAHVSLPQVRITLPAGACPNTVTVDTGVDASVPVDIQFEGTCRGGALCLFDDWTTCDDAGVRLNSSTLCACDDAGWACSTDFPWSPFWCVAPIVCPVEPLPYAAATDAGAILPSGRCANGEQCLVRTREQCADRTTGTTSAYRCGCAPVGLPTWDCPLAWATQTSCNADAGAPSNPTVDKDGGADFIHVEGDGDPYDMVDGLAFVSAAGCGAATLSGCLAAHTPPCVSATVAGTDMGTYADRNGDVWTLTSANLQPAPGQRSIAAPSAEGTLSATATFGGAVRHLVLTFRTPFEQLACTEAASRARDGVF